MPASPSSSTRPPRRCRTRSTQRMVMAASSPSRPAEVERGAGGKGAVQEHALLASTWHAMQLTGQPASIESGPTQAKRMGTAAPSRTNHGCVRHQAHWCGSGGCNRHQAVAHVKQRAAAALLCLLWFHATSLCVTCQVSGQRLQAALGRGWRCCRPDSAALPAQVCGRCRRGSLHRRRQTARRQG